LIEERSSSASLSRAFSIVYAPCVQFGRSFFVSRLDGA